VLHVLGSIAVTLTNPAQKEPLQQFGNRDILGQYDLT
jgi:hypothetical protein